MRGLSDQCNANASREAICAEDFSTRERFKRAARRLFALHGIDAVAVRDILAAAGQKNASALNYYFGSKEGLIETLIGDALAIAHGRWDEALRALDAQGGPRTIREVVELLVLQGLSPNAPEGDEASARFLAMVLQTRRDLVRAATARRGLTAYNRALRHIRRLMPAMSERARDQRLLFYFSASTAVLAVLEEAAKPGGGYAPPWNGPDPLRNFIDAMVGMFEAVWDARRAGGQRGATQISSSARRRLDWRGPMKAAVLERRGADGVSWRDFPDPEPTADDSVLRVVASSLNRVDLYMRDSGAGITHALPQVMGVEAAGVIAQGRARQRVAGWYEGCALFRGVLRPLPLLPRRRPALVRTRQDHG